MKVYRDILRKVLADKVYRCQIRYANRVRIIKLKGETIITNDNVSIDSGLGVNGEYIILHMRNGAIISFYVWDWRK